MNTRELLLNTWHWNPLALAGIVGIIAGAALLSRQRTQGGSGKSSGSGAARRAAWYGAALLVFVLTEVSPLDLLARGYLFSAHMLQHLLLLLIVPALLLLSLPAPARPPLTGAPNGPPRLRRWSAHPVLCWISGVGAMWLWHVPTLCDAASVSAPVRAVQTFSLLGMGTLFWWPVIGAARENRMSPLSGVLYLFTACVGCTVLGIYITFVPVSVCPVFTHPVDELGLLPLIRNDWGLTPSIDQQIGGLIMWVPACLIYFCGIMGLLLRWYSGMDLVAGQQPVASTQPANS